MIEIKHRGRGPRIYLPIVPYIAYDYPYYYSRGYYPTHIGPDMSTMVIRTATEAVIIRDTAADTPLVTGDASPIGAFRNEDY